MRIAQGRRFLEDDIEYPAEVGWRTADHTKDFSSRCLLRDRFLIHLAHVGLAARFTARLHRPALRSENVGTGCANPLRLSAPTASKSNTPSSAAMVLRSASTWPPFASAHRRAARLVTLPMAA